MHIGHRAFSLVLAAALVAGCESTTTTQPDVDLQLAKGSGNGVVAKATGSGVRAESARHFQFSAIEKADGSVSGQFNLTNEGSGNFSGHGEVVCVRVDGSRAWIGTVITHSSAAEFVGTEGGFYVEDNGEGKGAPDRLSLAFFNGLPGLAQRVCEGATDIEFSAAPSVFYPSARSLSGLAAQTRSRPQPPLQVYI